MRKACLALFAFIVSVAFAQSPAEELGKFFSREGYVIKLENGQAFVDLGKGKVKEGEVFSVVEEGKEIINPVTGKVLGKERRTVGEVKIDKVYDGYSIAKIISGKNIRVGDKAILYVHDVCYEGSDEGFFKVSSVVEGLKRVVDALTR